MNLIQVKDAPVTMCSREIAVLTKKRHADVKRDIEKMLLELKEDVRSFAHIYRDTMNRDQVEYYLDRELTDTLLTGYSAVLRRAVIVRWRELEGSGGNAIDLTNPHALRAALLTYSERVIELETKVEADAPKVAFAEVIRAMDAVCHIGTFCKTMKVGRNTLFKRMKEQGILMQNRMPYQKYIDKGYFSVIEQEPYTNSKGETRTTFTTMVTGAGQVFLAKRFADMIGSAA